MNFNQLLGKHWNKYKGQKGGNRLLYFVAHKQVQNINANEDFAKFISLVEQHILWIRSISDIFNSDSLEIFVQMAAFLYN